MFYGQIMELFLYAHSELTEQFKKYIYNDLTLKTPQNEN